MTLKLDGGGGQREVTGSKGRSREIVVDQSAVMLGNTFSPGINKSFQGGWSKQAASSGDLQDFLGCLGLFLVVRLACVSSS